MPTGLQLCDAESGHGSIVARRQRPELSIGAALGTPPKKELKGEGKPGPTMDGGNPGRFSIAEIFREKLYRALMFL